MIWTLLFVGISAYFAWKGWMSINSKFHILDRTPGPHMYPILGNGITFMGTGPAQMFSIIRELFKKHGDRYLIKVFNRRILHITHPDDIEIVLSHSKNIKKNKPYRFLEPWLGQGLLLSNGSKWHRRRKILTPAFHFNILRNFATIIDEKSRELVKGLQQQGHEAEVDLMPVISNFTLHTICETAMGTQLDVDKSNASVQYKNAILKVGAAMLERLTRVWLHVDIIYSLTERGKIFKKYLTILHTFADNVIKERKANMKSGDLEFTKAAVEGEEVLGTKKRLAMLDLLLAAEEKGEIDLEGIREEVNTFMFEGHDTTSMAITFGLMLLAKHKDVQEKLYEECQLIFGECDRTPTMSDLSEMKYTEAVIKETLRLYPSVPFIAREITEDFMLRDLLVKAGAEVAIHIYDVHRRPEYFPDPEKFSPERFLGGNITDHPFAYIPFSAGSRNCIGQRFAMHEMKCALSEISRAFVLESVSDEPMQLVADLVLRPAGPVRVKFIRRT